jgi:hypothetical protein
MTFNWLELEALGDDTIVDAGRITNPTTPLGLEARTKQRKQQAKIVVDDFDILLFPLGNKQSKLFSKLWKKA